MLQALNDSTEDSDSDEEDLRKLAERSQSQFLLAETAFVKSSDAFPSEFVRILSLLFAMQTPLCVISYKWFRLIFLTSSYLVLRLLRFICNFPLFRRI